MRTGTRQPELTGAANGGFCPFCASVTVNGVNSNRKLPCFIRAFDFN